jgi:hypothetical protein
LSSVALFLFRFLFLCFFSGCLAFREKAEEAEEVEED